MGQRRNLLRVISVDTETDLFGPANRAPKIACMSACWNGGEALWDSSDLSALRERIEGWLDDHDVLLVGQNFAYDVGVFIANFPDIEGKFFRAYDDDRVTDTKIRQQLLDISSGQYRGVCGDAGVWIPHNYSLFDLAKRHLGVTLDKSWQKGYGPLIGVPQAQWPEEARRYPCDDASATRGVYIQQEKHVEYIPSQFHETRSALWLSLMATWGLRTDLARVNELAYGATKERDELQAELMAAGLVRKDGSRDTKAAMGVVEAAWESSGQQPRLTQTGRIALDEDSCKLCGDDIMLLYARYSTLGKVLFH